MYLADVYTVPVNLAGLAAVSVPCGLDPAGLPVGMQVMVDRFQESLMFRIAGEYEVAVGGPPDPPRIGAADAGAAPPDAPGWPSPSEPGRPD